MLQEPPSEHKYPLDPPPAPLLQDLALQLATLEPPRYESQLRRKGAQDFGEDEQEAQPAELDEIELMEDLENSLQEVMKQDEAQQTRAAAKLAKAKAKAKAKCKAAPKAKGRKKVPLAKRTDHNEEHEDEQVEPPAKRARPSVDDDNLPPYPKDAYEPPAHITGNHIYSNTYKKQLAQGMSKAQAQEEARFQSLVYKTHGVVSQSKVGTFRAKKNAEKPKAN